jgi:RimJ/RimL family protein N-acetyltransferase
VRLDPLTAGHAGPLARRLGAGPDKYEFTWVPDGLDETRRYVERALAYQPTGRALAWAVRRRSDDQIVGCTRFLDLEVFGWPPPWPPGAGQGGEPSDDLPPSVAEIGSTWYAASAQRTGIYAGCKLLLLTHAFDMWDVLRITFKTDARNAASRRAIERLGAKAEGVRRAHSPASDGTVRDTAYYSIIKSEWPAVRDELNRCLAARSAQ